LDILSKSPILTLITLKTTREVLDPSEYPPHSTADQIAFHHLEKALPIEIDIKGLTIWGDLDGYNLIKGDAANPSMRTWGGVEGNNT
jgi:hypothetical protein